MRVRISQPSFVICFDTDRGGALKLNYSLNLKKQKIWNFFRGKISDRARVKGAECFLFVQKFNYLNDSRVGRHVNTNSFVNSQFGEITIYFQLIECYVNCK